MHLGAHGGKLSTASDSDDPFPQPGEAEEETDIIGIDMAQDILLFEDGEAWEKGNAGDNASGYLNRRNTEKGRQLLDKTGGSEQLSFAVKARRMLDKQCGRPHRYGEGPRNRSRSRNKKT